MFFYQATALIFAYFLLFRRKQIIEMTTATAKTTGTAIVAAISVYPILYGYLQTYYPFYSKHVALHVAAQALVSNTH